MTVRDLFGTVHNKGASKGILVTTRGGLPHIAEQMVEELAGEVMAARLGRPGSEAQRGALVHQLSALGNNGP